MIEFYGAYMIGQQHALTEALDLSALYHAFEIDGTEQEDRPQMTRYLIVAHRHFTEFARRRAKSRGGHG